MRHYPDDTTYGYFFISHGALDSCYNEAHRSPNDDVVQDDVPNEIIVDLQTASFLFSSVTILL